jgi:hypothetical protein
MITEVGGRSTRPPAGGKQIPQYFPCSCDSERHLSDFPYQFAIADSDLGEPVLIKDKLLIWIDSKEKIVLPQKGSIITDIFQL